MYSQEFLLHISMALDWNMCILCTYVRCYIIYSLFITYVKAFHFRIAYCMLYWKLENDQVIEQRNFNEQSSQEATFVCDEKYSILWVFNCNCIFN